MSTIVTKLYKPIGKTAIWDITSKCNLKCKHCYQSYDKMNLEFSNADITKIINNLIKLNVNHIHILGGEPLICKSINYLVKQAKANNLLVSINTNGTLLTEKMAEQLKVDGLDILTFSMDGGTDSINDNIRGNGVLKKVKNSIKIAQKAELHISIAFTISNENYLDFENVLKYCMENKINILRIIPVYNYSCANDNNIGISSYSIILDEIDKVIRNNINEIKECGLRFNSDFRLKVLEYFNRTYGDIMEGDAGGLLCQPGDNYFVIKADSIITPCIGFSNIEQNLTIKEENAYNLKCVENVESVRAVRDFRNKIFEDNYFSFCKRCDLFGNFCTPCPFYDKSVIEQCYWAMKKITERNKHLLNYKYNLKDGCMLKENYIINMQGEKCRVNNFLAEYIYRLTHYNKTANETISSLTSEKITDNERFEIIDIIDYLCNKKFLIKNEVD